MTPEGVLDIGTSAIQTILLVAGPMLGLSLVVGLLISAFQAMKYEIVLDLNDSKHSSLAFNLCET